MGLYYQIDQAFADGNLEEALFLLEQASQCCEVPSLREGLGDWVRLKCEEWLNAGYVEELSGFISLAEQAVDTSENEELKLAVQALKGRWLVEANRNEEACVIFEELAQQAEQAGRQEIAADAWHGLGVACHGIDRYAAATHYLSRAEIIYGRIGAEQKQAYSLYMLGMNQMDAGSPAEALVAHEKAAAILFRLGDLDELARVWHEQCICYLEQGSYEQALAKNEQVLLFYQQQQMNPERALSVRQGILFSLGRFNEALELWEELDELLNPEGDLRYFQEIWRGILFCHQQEFREGLFCLEKAAEYFGKKDLDLTAFVRCLSGLYLWLSGAEEQAEAKWLWVEARRAKRKTLPWLNGWLRRCLERIKQDFCLGDQRALSALIEKAINRCGFTIEEA